MRVMSVKTDRFRILSSAAGATAFVFELRKRRATKPEACTHVNEKARQRSPLFRIALSTVGTYESGIHR